MLRIMSTVINFLEIMIIRNCIYFMIIIIGYVLGVVPLEILPPIDDDVVEVYSITSSPIKINPVLVEPTETFSNVLNVFPVPLDTEIGSVEDLEYSAVSFVGLISGRIPTILTKLSSKFIP